jgi:hypothetical protein
VSERLRREEDAPQQAAPTTFTYNGFEHHRVGCDARFLPIACRTMLDSLRLIVA